MSQLDGLTTRRVDVAAWQARMEAKRAQAAHFRQLDAAVIEAANRPAPKQKRPRATGPRVHRAAADVIGTCPTCGRSTRPTTVRLNECPGTVPRVRGDLCGACVRRGGPPVAQRDRIRPCTGCGRMTRPSNTTADQYPGVIGRVTADLCASCAPRPAAPRPAGTPLPNVDVDVLIDLYVTKGHTAAEVSQVVGLSTATIISRLRDAGAPIHSRGYRRRQEQP